MVDEAPPVPVKAVPVAIFILAQPKQVARLLVAAGAPVPRRESDPPFSASLLQAAQIVPRWNSGQEKVIRPGQARPSAVFPPGR